MKVKRYLMPVAAALWVLLFGLYCGVVLAGPWPTDNITTTHVDSASDDPSQARAEIYTTMQRVKDVIGARGSASGVAPLDASSLVPLANIPSTLTGKSADTLDGINSTSFARVDAASNFTTAPTISSNTVWHAGNDGAGSGLDADTFKGSSTIAVANGGTGSTTASAARTALGAAASGANSDITSITGLTGALSSTKACASGYTRMTPNLCWRTDPTSVVNTAMTRDACTTVALPDSAAKGVVFEFDLTARSANSAGTYRFTSIVEYNASGCSGSNSVATVGGWEHTAVPTNAMATTLANVTLKPIGANTSIYVSFVDDAGNTGVAYYTILGYYD